MNEDKPKKKRWKFGKEMPLFSGKSYGELNDIYPINSRINDEVWRLVGLMYPAWVITKSQFKDQLPGKLKYTRFQELCWMQRCEEAKEGFAFPAYPAIKGMNVSGAIFAARKAELTKLGLVENIPLSANRARLYRVTGLGKMMIKAFVENLHAANNNLEMWLSMIGEENYKKITYYLVMQYPEWRGRGFDPNAPFHGDPPKIPKRKYVKSNHPRWRKNEIS